MRTRKLVAGAEVTSGSWRIQPPGSNWSLPSSLFEEVWSLATGDQVWGAQAGAQETA